jgi:hypothetical protein
VSDAETDSISNAERNAVIYTKANRIALHPADCYCDSCREAERKYRSDRSADLIADAERESIASADPFGNTHPCVYADCKHCAEHESVARTFYNAVVQSVALLRANRVAGPYTISLADDFPGNNALAVSISERKRDTIADIIRDIFSANDADAKYVTERICDALARTD